MPTPLFPAMPSFHRPSLSVPKLGKVSMGADIGSIIPASAKEVSMTQMNDPTTGMTGVRRGFDLDGDGAADVTRIDQFWPASGNKRTSLQLTVGPENGNHTVYNLSSDNGSNVTGLDRLATRNGRLTELYMLDTNNDGRVDYQSNRQEQLTRVITDRDFDGSVDDVHIWK